MAFRVHKRPRVHYWSSWVANTIYKLKHKEKPVRKTSYSIDEMFSELNKPIPFVERIVDNIQSAISFPADFIYSVKIYISNVKNQSHVLSGSLEKGQWCDLDYRISHCLFSELDKFITKEKGLKCHEWEKSLVKGEDMGYGEDHPEYGTPTNQALAAIEQEAIWSWWKENKDQEFYKEEVDSEGKIKHTYDLEGEEKQKEEETEMLIRLIKIRGSLWT